MTPMQQVEQTQRMIIYRNYRNPWYAMNDNVDVVDVVVKNTAADVFDVLLFIFILVLEVIICLYMARREERSKGGDDNEANH